MLTLGVSRLLHHTLFNSVAKMAGHMQPGPMNNSGRRHSYAEAMSGGCGRSTKHTPHELPGV